MQRIYLDARDVDQAREEIFDLIQRYRDRKVIYFHGWSGFAAAPVLTSIAQELRSIKANKDPPELCFDRIIYIDCSAWKSQREMQRKIAEELQLGLETIAMFDKQDEEDDFNGLDHGSRDVIRSVSQAIAQILVYKKFMMIFLNGSDDEVDLSRFGITPEYLDHIILWTFKRRSLTIRDWRGDKTEEKLRYTHVFLRSVYTTEELTSSNFSALLCGEAADIVTRHPCMRAVDQAIVTRWCMYELFLQYSILNNATRFDQRAAHSPNYWMCDGIIEEDVETREISDTLCQEIHWEWGDASQLRHVFEKLMGYQEAPFMVVKDDTIYEKRPCHWISITSKNLAVHGEDMQTIIQKATSLFISLERSDDNYPQGLPNGFLKPCRKLSVLILYQCAFRFVSPPFLRLHRLRFLGLDHCTNNSTSEGENNNTDWTCLQNLWVLDLRYTEWEDILSEEKMDIMANLRELDIEGFMCWRLTTRLHGRLPRLQRLRIVKPTRKVDTSIDTCNSFVDKTKLEILDLSGNRDIENLSISSSTARTLQMLILDGCDGLEKVLFPDELLSSLRLFSFDGYGPATHWMPSFKPPLESSRPERPPDAPERVSKTSKISLQGCTQLENLFVRGLPNLVELDLSASAIKVLDLETTVVDVPKLKHIILLGCEHLCTIKRGPFSSGERELVLCIDTRPWRMHGFTQPSPCKRKSFRLQLLATLADARLARSLCELVNSYESEEVYLDIHVTSSTKYGGGAHTESIGKERIGHSNQQHHILASRYSDVYPKIGIAPMLDFSHTPHQIADRYVHIGDGSRGLESELEFLSDNWNLNDFLRRDTESLHVRNTSTSACMPGRIWHYLRCCRVERCPNLEIVFPSNADEAYQLQSIRASDLQMARCIWSKGYRQQNGSFGKLQHLHLHSCPMLQFVLPVWVASFPSLETIHIIHCGKLRHVFVLDGNYPKEFANHCVPFPKLATIHLHDLPELRQICEVKMLAPALKSIRIRGCFSLRRLPVVAAARGPGEKKPTVELEKDVWDKLEWDGLAAGHHPDLFEPPVHSRYYRRSRLLRGTVLR